MSKRAKAGVAPPVVAEAPVEGVDVLTKLANVGRLPMEAWSLCRALHASCRPRASFRVECCDHWPSEEQAGRIFSTKTVVRIRVDDYEPPRPVLPLPASLEALTLTVDAHIWDYLRLQSDVLPALRALRLQNVTIDAPDLRRLLGAAPALRELHYSGWLDQVDDDGLALPSSLRKLHFHELSDEHNVGEDGGAKELDTGTLPEGLIELHINTCYTRIRHGASPVLPKTLRKLTVLHCAADGPPPAYYDSLQGLPEGLRELWWCGAQLPQKLPTSLTALTVGDDVDELEIAALPPLPRLVTLRLHGRYSHGAITVPSSLASLSIGGTTITFATT
jgi:hypothetical protein